ncbi:MAG: His-Xaa-Ser system protein HxsD [Candidatus Margulisbacteria bacterium]|nr:His-Xaa-Ser system protein HxsD [Candidatus Margulisiibacteriota bacterium]
MDWLNILLFIVKGVEFLRMLIKINLNTFEKNAILAASYKFTNHYYVQFNEVPNNHLEVNFRRKNNDSPLDENISEEFLNEALDQQIRINVERQCGKTRDLIVEKAFSPLKQS